MKKYRLILFIGGTSSIAATAKRDLEQFCERHLQPNYELEVVNILVSPEVAKKYQIIATPTVIRELPRPMIRLVGSFSNHEEMLNKLGITK